MKSSLKAKFLFGIALLTGLIFINAGLNKFLNYMPPPDHLPRKLEKAMTAFMEIGWLMPLTGLVEITGGILLAVPRTRALGVLVLLPVMAGIILTNTVQNTSGLPITLVLSAVFLWIIYEHRAQYRPLIA